MNDSLEIGQVLSLRIRFNNDNLISSSKHPYLIVDINDEFNTVEIAQIDSLDGKEYKAAMRSNKPILNSNPIEKVIDKDSYVQMDNIFLVENHPALINHRRQRDKLSEGKLNDVLDAYHKYHSKHHIDENKQVYMTWEEIHTLNT